MIRSTRSLASQATTTFTSIANPTSNVQRIRLVVNPPNPILTSAPISTSLPTSNHVFAVPVSARRAGDNRVAIGNPYAIAPTPTLPDPAPARWVNAPWIATGNTVPTAHASASALPAVGAGATVPGVSATSSRVSSVATTTAITPPVSPVTTSAAIPATTSAPTPTTTSAAVPATIPAATPATTTSAPTPPARQILTPRPVRALRAARAARATTGDGAAAARATGENGENGEEERYDDDEDEDDNMKIDWKHGDLEYMEVDWCEVFFFSFYNPKKSTKILHINTTIFYIGSFPFAYPPFFLVLLVSRSAIFFVEGRVYLPLCVFMLEDTLFLSIYPIYLRLGWLPLFVHTLNIPTYRRYPIYLHIFATVIEVNILEKHYGYEYREYVIWRWSRLGRYKYKYNEVEVTSSTVLAIFNGAVNVFRTIKTRSGVTGGFVPLGGAEEDGISADGLVERRQGSVCSYYGWWSGEGALTLWLPRGWLVAIRHLRSGTDVMLMTTSVYVFDIKTILHYNSCKLVIMEAE
ncbi:hypothetical protein BDC45DRAFT_534609 [Circinella umbellata]|nr:hypothetical protein BDC45DRAFT_534609 [Circinella umbellata]